MWKIAIFISIKEFHLMKANENSKEYLKTKKEYFGHFLDDETEK